MYYGLQLYINLNMSTYLLGREKFVISLKTALGTLTDLRSAEYQIFQHYADSCSPQLKLFNLTVCNI
jgi:hypothetical protein